MRRMKTKRLKPGDPSYRHPYVDYEADPLWPLIEKGIADLVKNQDLIEQTNRNYIVGHLCKVVSKGRKAQTLAKRTKD
jgi:hypothetical protein